MKKAILLFSLLAFPGLVHADWHEFYLIGGGSNTNSGSTTDSMAPVISSSGSWGLTGSGAPNRYVSTFSAFGSVSVGQMASIFIATTTGSAIFVSSIVAVISATTIDLDTTTIKYGLTPTGTASNQWACKIGGAWETLAGPLTGLFNSRTVPQSTRINIKAGTYANTTNTRTFGASGGNGNLLWWRGYKTTPGDQDSNNLAVVGTDIPSWTWTSAGMGITGNFQKFSNISMSGAFSTANSFMDTRGINTVFYRCRIINSTNVANGAALIQNSAAKSLLIQSCYLQSSTMSTTAITCSGTSQCYIFGSVIVGGGIGISLSGTGSTLYESKIYGQATNSINVGAAGGVIVLNNDIYAPGNNGVNINVPPAEGVVVFNNYFDSVPGTAISLGLSTDSVHVSGNAYYNCTLNVSTTNLEGFAPYDNSTSLSQSAFVDPTNQNFSKIPVVFGLAYPSLWENLPNQPQSYLDPGAGQAPRESSYVFGN